MKNISFFFSLLFLLSCATMDVPSGGDKDITPPQIVTSTPDSAGTNFKGKKISILFDEYFSLNNLSNQLIISPTLSTPPTISIKGKYLQIELNDDLKDNTTYQLYFGDGIKDVNEGNKTNNLRLVFSTGNQIDTGFLGGTVHDSYKRTPIKDCKVFLYETQQDSQLIKETPLYITKTDKTGSFTFNNIFPKKYYMYAVADENNNNKLDLDEGFAVLKKECEMNNTSNMLLLSPHKTQFLRINDITEISKNYFKTVFSQELNEFTTQVTSNQSLYKNKELPWHFGDKKDTIYFSSPSNLEDSFSVLFQVDTLEFSENLISINDKSSKKSLHINHTISPEEIISLKSTYPIKKVNSTLVALYDLTDSVFINPVVSEIKRIGSNKLDIKSSLKEGHSYHIYTQSDYITYLDESGSKLDTLDFQTFSKNQTGEIEVHYQFDSSYLKSQSSYYAVLLLNEKIISSTPLLKDTVITYNYLKPDNYSVYVFEDLDNNYNWSSANYFKNVSAEQIWWLNSPLEVRAKWKNKNIILIIK